MSFNKTVQIYIFDGNPNGRIMCELSNWNGRIYKVNRNELSLFAGREDATNTGFYFLFGKNEENQDTVYIGEAENVLARLKQHLKDTDYWNDCIIIISKDNLLNKAHVKYLENRFYLLAKSAGRSVIINGSKPTCSSVSEYDQCMLEEFFNNTKLLVNILGYKIFDSIEETAMKQKNHDVIFSITATRGAKATGKIVADGFVVLKNSRIASSVTPSMAACLVKFRNSLIENNIINKEFTFTKDYLFTSPSLAAAVVMGRNANGRAEWKTDKKQSLKKIEESALK